MQQGELVRVPSWTVGDRMRKALDVAGVSVADMADYLDVSRQTIGRWINNHGPVKVGTLRLWSLRTGVDLGWLETGTATSEGGRSEVRHQGLEPRTRWLTVA